MVAPASRSQANGKSPVQNLFHLYFGGLEAMGKTYDPLMKSIARAQLELMGYFTRRAQAVMEAPGRLSQCRTPQDVANEQMRFWRTAYEEYAESMGRVTEAVAAAAVPSFGGPSSDEVQSAHDYITFAEPKESGRGQRDRKVA
jgi:hypothetical protein